MEAYPLDAHPNFQRSVRRFGYFFINFSKLHDLRTTIVKNSPGLRKSFLRSVRFAHHRARNGAPSAPYELSAYSAPLR
jgi:hypothetical protein